MDTLIRWMRHDARFDLLELALVAALGVVLAHATWIAVAPRALGAPAAPVAQKRADTPAAQRLFGTAQAGAAPAARASPLAGYTLLGVFSGRDAQGGRAIFARPGDRPVSLAAGERLAEGLALKEVHPDHVIVLRDGAPERIELERAVVRRAPPAAPLRVPPGR